MSIFELEAVLGLNSSDYEEGLAAAEGKANTFGSGVGKALGSAVKTGGKLLTAATGAAVTAVGAVGKGAVEAYASYEQLSGGVAKLYGNAGQSLEEYAKSAGKSIREVREQWADNQKAQEILMANADKAYQTSGMSANEYMEQATSFSAALINSLGGDTKKAAKLTDVAMRAMSDNINTFGSDAESVQNAFQGFAKGNYTMLDNLSKMGALAA